MQQPLTLGFLSSAFLILSLAAPLTAQITFQRAYGGWSWDEGYSVAQTTDGGYIITSITYSFGGGHGDVWLIKTNAFGDTMWTRTYDGGTTDDCGYSVAQTADGGYVVAGVTKPFGADPAAAWLIKTDAWGDTMWTRTYGGEDRDWGYAVALTTDGGYVITGYTKSFGAGGEDVWLIKTDSSGDTIWTRTFGGPDDDRAYMVTQTTDGGYVITGRTESFGAGEFDAYLIKTDASGDTIWTRTFGGTDSDIGYSGRQTADGGYIVTGETRSFGAGGRDAWLIKTDASGDTIWTRTYGGAAWDGGYVVRQNADSGYIIVGWTGSFSVGSGDVWLIRTDADGNSTTIAKAELPATYKPAAATIAHAVLYIRKPSTRYSSLTLLNPLGREVMDLQPGPNDVRHIPPGAYFVRQVAGQNSRLSKVVVTR